MQISINVGGCIGQIGQCRICEQTIGFLGKKQKKGMYTHLLGKLMYTWGIFEGNTAYELRKYELTMALGGAREP